jgi:hypothetical protein
VSIGEPTADWDGVLWVENIRRRRVIDNDSILQVASKLREILDVVAVVVEATLAEQAVVDNIVDIELIQKRITVLPKR